MAPRGHPHGRRPLMRSSSRCEGASRSVLAVWLVLLTVGALVMVPAAAGSSVQPGPSASASDGGSPPDTQASENGATSPDRGRSPDDAGQPDDPGKPDDAGRPDDSGQSDDAGRPDDPGKPDAPGAPGDTGSSEGASADDGRQDGDPPDGPGDRSDGSSHRGDGTGPAGPHVEVTIRRPGGGSPQFPGRDPPFSPGIEGGSSIVDVVVDDVEPGASVSIDVSPGPFEDAETTFDDVSMRVLSGGAFTMSVVSSQERLPGSPAFDTGPGTEALGRIRLEHSIDNADVDDVSFTFRVSKGRLRAADVDPEAVALYRFADGEWTALPTRLVGEEDGHYLLRADSPGLSEFAVGVRRPSFETRWAVVDRSRTDLGEVVGVTALISNVGGADGTVVVELVVGQDVVDHRQLTIAAGGTRQVSFRAPMHRGGTHRVYVDGVYAGAVTVTAEPEPARSGALTRRISSTLDRLLQVGRVVVVGVDLPVR